MIACLASDVRAATDVEGLLRHLDGVALRVRRAVCEDRLAVALRPAPALATSLVADPTALRRLRHDLDARGLDVVAVDSCGGAGDEHRPDWGARGRLPYTLDCVALLAELLPADVEQGTVLTLGLGAGDRWSALHTARATTALTRLAAGLRPSVTRCRRIQVALVPEPGLVLDTFEEAVIWLAGRVDPALVGVCADPRYLTAANRESDPVSTVERAYRVGLPPAAVTVPSVADDEGLPCGVAAVLGAVRRRPRLGPDPLLLVGDRGDAPGAIAALRAVHAARRPLPAAV